MCVWASAWAVLLCNSPVQSPVKYPRIHFIQSLPVRYTPVSFIQLSELSRGSVSSVASPSQIPQVDHLRLMDQLKSPPTTPWPKCFNTHTHSHTHNDNSWGEWSNQYIIDDNWLPIHNWYTQLPLRGPTWVSCVCFCLVKVTEDMRACAVCCVSVAPLDIWCVFVLKTRFRCFSHAQQVFRAPSSKILSPPVAAQAGNSSADKQMECVLQTQHALLSKMLLHVITAYFHWWTRSSDSVKARCSHATCVFIYLPPGF